MACIDEITCRIELRTALQTRFDFVPSRNHMRAAAMRALGASGCLLCMCAQAAPTNAPTSPPSDAIGCAELLDMGHSTSRVYTVVPRPGGTIPPRDVYCDQETDGGGWTLMLAYQRNVPRAPFSYSKSLPVAGRKWTAVSCSL